MNEENIMSNLGSMYGASSVVADLRSSITLQETTKAELNSDLTSLENRIREAACDLDAERMTAVKLESTIEATTQRLSQDLARVSKLKSVLDSIQREWTESRTANTAVETTIKELRKQLQDTLAEDTLYLDKLRYKCCYP
jgi:chromosome segregation ATPase